MTRLAVNLVMLAMLCVSQSQARVIDDFDDGNLIEYGVAVNNCSASPLHCASAVAAHDGPFGLLTSATIVRSDPAAHIQRGDVISYWVNPKPAEGGRAYFALGDHAYGAHPTVVLAPNTNQFIAPGSGGAVSQVYQDQWYRVEIDWATNGNVTGKLFDSDGTTLLNTASGFSSRKYGNTSVRGFNTKHFDTFEILNPDHSSLPIVAPGSTVAGQTIAQWHADYWNWSHSFTSSAADPASDPTGVDANSNQSGDVFFLAGNKIPPPNRTFELPAGKHILVPLLSGVYVRSAGESPTFVKNFAEGVVSNPDDLFFSLDGVSVPFAELLGHREPTGFFTSIQPAGSVSGEPAGSWTDSYGDGYVVMLEPLEPGAHTIRFGGQTCLSGNGNPCSATNGVQFSVEVTDNVTVPAQILLGDANNDGTVTADDLVAVQQFFGTAGPPFDGTLLGDANDDGVVTADDLIAVQQFFGNALVSDGPPVPAPATLTLLGLGLMGLGRRRG